MTLFTSIVNDDMPCGGLHNIDDDEKNIDILSYPKPSYSSGRVKWTTSLMQQIHTIQLHVSQSDCLNRLNTIQTNTKI